MTEPELLRALDEYRDRIEVLTPALQMCLADLETRVDPVGKALFKKVAEALE